jgi:hypothetical protein
MIKETPRKEPKLGKLTIEGRVVGRDKKVVDPRQVEIYASLGLKDTEIGDLLELDYNTLRYNFKAELTKGRANLKMSLRQKQLQVAMEGNVTMLIFLGKVYLGQREDGSDNDENQPLPWSDDEL